MTRGRVGMESYGWMARKEVLLSQAPYFSYIFNFWYVCVCVLVYRFSLAYVYILVLVYILR